MLNFFLRQWVSKFGLRTSSISITWELVRNANSSAPMIESRFAGGAQQSAL